VQNAKDSIVGDPTRDSVDVIVTATKDSLEFKHNGAPFTADALLSLLYKSSEGKENAESTGRFGTGFLTTHCLSKEVTIRSDMYKDEAKRSYNVPSW
jgi:HSP90 family molecular chaperone